MSTASTPAAPQGARELLTALVKPAPSPPRLAIAIQAALVMALAVGMPALAGRTDLGLLASTGALSALYFSARSRSERLRRLPLVQLGLLVAVALGTVGGAFPVVTPVLIAVVAIGAVVLVSASAVGPPGAFIPVLCAGVGARLTAPVAAGGDGLSPWLVLGCAAAGMVLSSVVVVAPLALPSIRRRDAAIPVAPLRFSLDATARTVVIRVSIASVIGAGLAAVLGLERGYWVVVAVVAVLQAGHGRRVGGIRAIHRATGTLIGAVVFAAVATVVGLPAQGVLLAIALGLLQFGAEMTVVRHYGIGLLLVTPLALLIAEAGSTGDPWTIAGTRVLDTAIGCAIALLVLLGDRLVSRRP